MVEIQIFFTIFSFDETSIYIFTGNLSKALLLYFSCFIIDINNKQWARAYKITNSILQCLFQVIRQLQIRIYIFILYQQLVMQRRRSCNFSCMVDIVWREKTLDLTIYTITNKACAALRPHKCTNGPLRPPKVMTSLWLHQIPLCLTTKCFDFSLAYQIQQPYCPGSVTHLVLPVIY